MAHLPVTFMPQQRVWNIHELMALFEHEFYETCVFNYQEVGYGARSGARPLLERRPFEMDIENCRADLDEATLLQRSLRDRHHRQSLGQDTDLANNSHDCRPSGELSHQPARASHEATPILTDTLPVLLAADVPQGNDKNAQTMTSNALSSSWTRFSSTGGSCHRYAEERPGETRWADLIMIHQRSRSIDVSGKKREASADVLLLAGSTYFYNVVVVPGTVGPLALCRYSSYNVDFPYRSSMLFCQIVLTRTHSCPYNNFYSAYPPVYFPSRILLGPILTENLENARAYLDNECIAYTCTRKGRRSKAKDDIHKAPQLSEPSAKVKFEIAAGITILMLKNVDPWPTAIARRPPWTFKLPAPLLLLLGTEVVSVAPAELPVAVPVCVAVLLAPVVWAPLLLLSLLPLLVAADEDLPEAVPDDDEESLVVVDAGRGSSRGSAGLSASGALDAKVGGEVNVARVGVVNDLDGVEVRVDFIGSRDLHGCGLVRGRDVA
ncbi:hypothetical protein KCU88_g463, partial [Aureobasidium melanogenum]